MHSQSKPLLRIFGVRNSFENANASWRKGAVFAVAAIGFLLATGRARADCAKDLAPLFNPPANASGNAVYATVSSQYAQGYVNGWWSTKSDSDADPVSYANGEMSPSLLWWPSGKFFYQAESLSGTLKLRFNDLFGPSIFTLKLAVNTNGQVSIQELINGQPILNQPAFVAQGECSAGLVTLRALNNSSVQWTISFTTSHVVP